MGTLICDKCGGYYELQPGEHPEDFDRCDCGGKLRYERRMIEDDNPSPESRFKLPLTTKNLKILSAGALAIILLFIVLSFAFEPRQYFHQYGKYLWPALFISIYIYSWIYGIRGYL